jgi:hypothetical protein
MEKNTELRIYACLTVIFVAIHTLRMCQALLGTAQDLIALDCIGL